MKKTVLFTLVFYSVMVFAKIAVCDTSDKRKAESTQRINDANSLIQNYSVQRAALDGYFYGPDGVRNHASQWLEESQKIINAADILSTLQQVTDSTTASKALRLIEAFYNEQGPVIARMKQRSRVMMKSQERLKSLAKSVAELPSPKTEELKVLYGQLEESRKRGLVATDTIYLSIKGLEPKVLKLLSDSRPILVNRLKKMIIEKSWKELEVPLAAVADLMLFEAEVRPLIVELEDIGTRLTEATLNFAYFQATDSKFDADNACMQFQQKLESISVSSKSKKYGLERKQALCGAVDTLWLSFQQSGLSKTEMVKEYGALKRAQFQAVCRTATSLVNCEKFASLAAIQDKTIDAMIEPQLRFYEEAWRGLEKSL